MITETMNIHTERISESKLQKVDFDNLPFGTVFSDHMLISDYNGTEWTNTAIVPFGDIQLSPSISSLHYGQAIFEGMKAYKNGEGDIMLFRPDANWKRFNKSAERMCMPAVPEEIFIEGLKELVNLDRDWVSEKDGFALYIRPFMFATDKALGVRPSRTYKFIIITAPVGSFFSEPVKVKIETEFSRACRGGVGYAKAAGNYGGAMYPQKLAQDKGYHQVIWTDANEHRYIEEAGAMNVAFVINNKLITAPTGGTILEGITRDSVLTLARDFGVEVEERKIEVTEVIDAIKEGQLQEAFGMGTAATIAPIIGIAHEGTDYDLSVNRNTDLSSKLAAMLDAIRKGKAEDRYGWVLRV